MQTFLPYPNIYKSLNCLDYRRLGNQRSEALMILRNITGQPNSWRNHPAVRMWRGYPDALKLYMNMCIKLWIKRGYRNTMELAKIDFSKKIEFPPWFGDKKFHRAHRKSLLFKDETYYRRFFKREKPEIKYVWPIS